MSGAASGLEPTQFCQEIHLCSAQSLSPKKRDVSQFVCDRCHAFADDVELTLKNPGNEQKVIAVLTKICGIFSLFGYQQRYQDCVSGIEPAVSGIFAKTEEEFQPDKFCQELHACPAPPKTVQRREASQVCDACQTVIGKIDSILSNPDDQQKIEHFIDTVCGIFKIFGQDQQYQECKQKVDDYVQRVLSGAAGDLEPHKFCQEIHLCSASFSKRDMSQFICSNCQTVASSVEKLFVPGNEVKVQQALVKMCDIFSFFQDQQHYAECAERIYRGVDTVFSGAESDFEPNKFCQELHACPAQQKFVQRRDIPQQFCDACHSVVGKIDQSLSDPATLKTVRSVLEKLCQVFKVFHDDQNYNLCIKTVDDTVDRILSGAATGLEPNKFCKEIHVCSS